MSTEAHIDLPDKAGDVEDAEDRDQPSELERWSRASMARGVIKMREELARLRERGMIDDQGKLLVPLPEDMNPESKTDL